MLFNAEYDDGIAAILAVERVRLPYLEQTIRFLQRTTHGKGDLKDLVARGLSLAHEDLVAEGLVEVGAANDIDATQAFLFKKCLKVFGKTVSKERAAERTTAPLAHWLKPPFDYRRVGLPRRLVLRNAHEFDRCFLHSVVFIRGDMGERLDGLTLTCG